MVGFATLFFCLFSSLMLFRVSEIFFNLNVFLQLLLVGVPTLKSAVVGMLESPVDIWLANSSEGKLVNSLVVALSESVLAGLLRFSCTQVNSRSNTVKGTRHTSAP